MLLIEKLGLFMLFYILKIIVFIFNFVYICSYCLSLGNFFGFYILIF